MSDNIRLRTVPGESKNINVKINQKFDFIEILSLKISQADAYRRFCSDYGVVVGRVIVNQGIGVPNAKVSIFIPLDEEDTLDPETVGLYPFEVVTDKDGSGIPYNLLPKFGDGSDDCHTSIGTFPSKREVQDNPELGEIYCKYYKFTTTTNDSGDYMIFGIPTGPHYIHVDVDMSDIGILSQKPYDLIEQGASPDNFVSPSKFKGRNEASSLNQLKTVSPIGIEVIPFWGDTDECEIGISRVDVDLSSGGGRIVPSALFIGSLFSDNEKDGINKRCRPRKDTGQLKRVVTGPGMIEMIRKTPGGRIERFDVKGGQVIGDDGTWSYLIPMNLDYMITAEDGTMQLTEDTNRGIPTKSDVRFRISMNIAGDEGALRTRAKYLVPNNPVNKNSVDYNFGPSTTAASFKTIYWNKIYSVKNYIARVQPDKKVENRNFIGIKDVNEGGGNTSFPFNKLDNDWNPLFDFLCVILNIFSLLMCTLNTLIIPAVNLVIYIINIILGAICSVLALISSITCGLKHLTSDTNRKNCRCTNCMNKKPCTAPSPYNVGCCSGNCVGACFKGILGYIPYVTMPCSEEQNGWKFAVCGWKAEFPPIKQTWRATLFAQSDVWTEPRDQGVDDDGNITNPPLPARIDFHYPGDGDIGHGGPGAGWIDCVAVGIARALELFKYDFYNDWINGALYPFLLKVKIKKQGEGKMKFCETDCEDNEDGTDNDANGESDNKCRKNYILDSCTYAPPFYSRESGWGGDGVNAKMWKQIKEGYIKRYNGEFYYSAISKKSGNRLFATDVINLGSMVDNDWQGIPSIHKYLIDTTSNAPPLQGEYDSNLPPGAENIEVTGFDTKLEGGNRRLIGNVFCLPIPIPLIGVAGVLTDEGSCINLRRLCELGVGLDENRTDENPNRGIVDNRITNNDVENPYVRGAFAWLNTPNPPSAIQPIYFDTPSGGLSMPGYEPPVPGLTNYDGAGKTFGWDGNIAYREFINGPGGTLKHPQSIKEHDNSFYFYFGLIPGRSALNNMNRKYFTECIPEATSELFIIGNTTLDDDPPEPTGTLTIGIVGGLAPYSISVHGPTVNNAPYDELFTDHPISELVLTDLFVGSYDVIVTDATGQNTSGIFIVDGAAAISCFIETSPAATNGASDGVIMINVTDGISPYFIDIFLADPITGVLSTTPVYSPTPSITTQSYSTTATSGTYKVVVTDSGPPITQCSEEVEVEQPDSLTNEISAYDVTCFGQRNGSITVTPNGGTGPYTFQWGPIGGAYSPLTAISSTGNTIGGLDVGMYDVEVTDFAGVVTTAQYDISEPSQTKFSLAHDDIGCKDDTDGYILVHQIHSENAALVSINGGSETEVAGNGEGKAYYNLPIGNYTIKVVDKINGCEATNAVTINEPETEFKVSPLVHRAINFSSGQALEAIVQGGWGAQPNGRYDISWEYKNLAVSTWTVYGSSAGNGQFINPYVIQLRISDSNYGIDREWRVVVRALSDNHETSHTSDGCKVTTVSVHLTTGMLNPNQ